MVKRIRTPGNVIENEDGSTTVDVLEMSFFEHSFPRKPSRIDNDIDLVEESPIRGIHCDSLEHFIEYARGEGIDPDQILNEIVQFCNQTFMGYIDSDERIRILQEGELRL